MAGPTTTTHAHPDDALIRTYASLRLGSLTLRIDRGRWLDFGFDGLVLHVSPPFLYSSHSPVSHLLGQHLRPRDSGLPPLDRSARPLFVPADTFPASVLAPSRTATLLKAPLSNAALRYLALYHGGEVDRAAPYPDWRTSSSLRRHLSCTDTLRREDVGRPHVQERQLIGKPTEAADIPLADALYRLVTEGGCRTVGVTKAHGQSSLQLLSGLRLFARSHSHVEATIIVYHPGEPEVIGLVRRLHVLHAELPYWSSKSRKGH